MAAALDVPSQEVIRSMAERPGTVKRGRTTFRSSTPTNSMIPKSVSSGIKKAMHRITEASVADTPSMEPPVAPDQMTSGPIWKNAMYTMTSPTMRLTKYRGDGEKILLSFSFF